MRDVGSESRPSRPSALLGTAEQLTTHLDTIVADMPAGDPRRDSFDISILRLLAERLSHVEQPSVGFPPAVFAMGATALADECALAGREQRPIDGLSAKANAQVALAGSTIIRLLSAEIARAVYGDEFVAQVVAVYLEDDRGAEETEQ
jgi:hypothetical protein